MTTKQKQLSLYSAACGLSSFLATFVTNALHPFELIKTRLQSHDGKCDMNLVPKYKGIRGAIYSIYKLQGIAGLYKGVLISFISQVVAQSLFFVVYQNRLIHYEGKHKLNHMKAVLYASLEGSIVGSVVSQPLWVIRTRMLLNTDASISEFQNFKRSASQIYQQYGWNGFARGLGISLLLCSNLLIQMYVYELSKKMYRHLEITSGSYGEEAFICGGIGKLVGVIATYPLSTVRTRVQQNQYILPGSNPKYNHVWDIVKKMWRQEGLRGYYKGLGANLLRGLPQRSLYFYFYELFRKMFHADSFKY